MTYLPYVDEIIMMENGCIAEKGTYDELIGRRGAFYDFVGNYTEKLDDTIEDSSNSGENFETALSSDQSSSNEEMENCSNQNK